MSRRHRSPLITAASMLLVSTSYAIELVRRADGVAITEVAYLPAATFATVALVLLLAAGHAVIAAVTPAHPDAVDETDRRATGAGRAAFGLVLAPGVVGAMALVAADTNPFWVFHTLLASLVLAELANAATRLHHGRSRRTSHTPSASIGPA